MNYARYSVLEDINGLKLRKVDSRFNLYNADGKSLFRRGFGNENKLISAADKKYAKGEPTFYSAEDLVKKSAKPSSKKAAKPSQGSSKT